MAIATPRESWFIMAPYFFATNLGSGTDRRHRSTFTMYFWCKNLQIFPGKSALRCFTPQILHLREKNPGSLTFHWNTGLFNLDPYNGLQKYPHNWVGFHPPHTLRNNKGSLFHCSFVRMQMSGFQTARVEAAMHQCCRPVSGNSNFDFFKFQIGALQVLQTFHRNKSVKGVKINSHTHTHTTGTWYVWSSFPVNILTFIYSWYL